MTLFPFMYVDKEEIHKYMQWEVSMAIFMGRIENQRKILKWLPLKTISLNHYTFGVLYKTRQYTRHACACSY